MAENPVVILTALNREYEAVLRRLVAPQPQFHERGTRFEIGTLRGTDCEIALALTGKGNQPAAVLAERAIQEFEPVAVMFVGVAGALRDGLSLGDVVVADHVYAYHGGTSEDDGLKARPRVWEAEHGIMQLASHVARLGDWADGPEFGQPHPSVYFGPLAAGEVVHNSRISYEAELVRQHYNDALAIEMESAGVAQAAHLNGSPVAIVRGISDLADGTKTSENDGTWQPRAADNAAAFATRLARELINEQGRHPMRYRTKSNGTGATHNVANGSTVGIQAGTITRSVVTIGATAPSASLDYSAELTAIREELFRARSSGSLDASTCAAAQEELNRAGQALEDDPNGKRGFVLALKRLRGLVDEAAEVASKVAALITAVNSLS